MEGHDIETKSAETYYKTMGMTYRLAFKLSTPQLIDEPMEEVLFYHYYRQLQHKKAKRDEFMNNRRNV